MAETAPNTLVVLGPTASGKTRLGIDLARRLGGEILSADSRQVYRGLDIGAGKDLDEYRTGGAAIPCHLMDIVDLDHEFSVFEYQRRCFTVVEALWTRRTLPVLVGGSGLYIEAVLSKYRMVDAPPSPRLRRELEPLTDARLEERLRALKPDLHNITDLTDRERTIRAIELAIYSASHEPRHAPDVRPFIIGLRWEHNALKRRIRTRLVARLDAGMIEEVEGLLARGISWKKLDFLGLEYRFVADFLRGTIRNRNDLTQKLAAAIYQFARKQEKWFRRMERNGTVIHWVDNGDHEPAMTLVSAQSFSFK